MVGYTILGGHDVYDRSYQANLGTIYLTVGSQIKLEGTSSVGRLSRQR